MSKRKGLDPGSWCEVKTDLRGTELLKIVGYRGEILECVNNEGNLTMVKPNSTKVIRIFHVDENGEKR